MKARLAGSVLFTLLMVRTSCPAEDVMVYADQHNWDHPDQVFVSDEELLFHVPASRFYRASSYFFGGYLNDGSTFVINIFHWTYSFLNNWGLKLQISEADGQTWSYEGKIPANRIISMRDRFQISFEGGTIEGNSGEHHILLNLDDFSCDLVIRNVLPPWKPGDGFVYFTRKRDAYIRTYVSSPLASVDGRLEVRGKRISASGWCTATRSLTVLPLTGFDYDYFGFFLFGSADPACPDPSAMMLHHYSATYRGKPLDIPLMLLIRDGGWVLTDKKYTLNPYEFVQEPGLPCPYPRRIRLYTENRGYSLEGEFICMRIAHCTDFLKELPPFVRALLSLVYDRPVIFNMVGFFQGSLQTPEGEKLELNLTGIGTYSVFR